jgi:membrane associated rhomboid family serine protease
MIHSERQDIMRGGPWKMVALWATIMIGVGLISGGDVSWQAHLGGFLSGVFLYYQMQRGRLRIQ